MDNNKLDRILENVAEINTTLKFQAKQLEEHIKRTNILEERVKPIEEHVVFIQKLIKLATAIIPLSGGLITGILKLLGKI